VFFFSRHFSERQVFNGKKVRYIEVQAYGAMTIANSAMRVYSPYLICRFVSHMYLDKEGKDLPV
jgi:hypothetical protein